MEENKAVLGQRITERAVVLYRGRGQPHQLVAFGQRPRKSEGVSL